MLQTRRSTLPAAAPSQHPGTALCLGSGLGLGPGRAQLAACAERWRRDHTRCSQPSSCLSHPTSVRRSTRSRPYEPSANLRRRCSTTPSTLTTSWTASPARCGASPVQSAGTQVYMHYEGVWLHLCGDVCARLLAGPQTASTALSPALLTHLLLQDLDRGLGSSSASLCHEQSSYLQA